MLHDGDGTPTLTLLPWCDEAGDIVSPPLPSSVGNMQPSSISLPLLRQWGKLSILPLNSHPCLSNHLSPSSLCHHLLTWLQLCLQLCLITNKCPYNCSPHWHWGPEHSKVAWSHCICGLWKMDGRCSDGTGQFVGHGSVPACPLNQCAHQPFCVVQKVHMLSETWWKWKACLL